MKARLVVNQLKVHPLSKFWFSDVNLHPYSQGFPVFQTHVEANHLLRKGDLFATHALTDEDKEDIRRLSRDPRIVQRLVKSMAPSIHGGRGGGGRGVTSTPDLESAPAFNP